jgi:hypothetical protein
LGGSSARRVCRGGAAGRLVRVRVGELVRGLLMLLLLGGGSVRGRRGKRGRMVRAGCGQVVGGRGKRVRVLVVRLYRQRQPCKEADGKRGVMVMMGATKGSCWAARAVADARPSFENADARHWSHTVAQSTNASRVNSRRTVAMPAHGPPAVRAKGTCPDVRYASAHPSVPRTSLCGAHTPFRPVARRNRIGSPLALTSRFTSLSYPLLEYECSISVCVATMLDAGKR